MYENRAICATTIGSTVNGHMSYWWGIRLNTVIFPLTQCPNQLLFSVCWFHCSSAQRLVNGHRFTLNSPYLSYLRPLCLVQPHPFRQQTCPIEASDLFHSDPVCRPDRGNRPALNTSSMRGNAEFIPPLWFGCYTKLWSGAGGEKMGWINSIDADWRTGLVINSICWSFIHLSVRASWGV